MDIANYITGSAHAAQRLTAEASLPPLRAGYSRTQELLAAWQARQNGASACAREKLRPCAGLKN